MIFHGPVSFKTGESDYTLFADGKALGTVEATPGNLLLSPQPIFDSLKPRDGVMEGEHVVIASWPVQFLPRNSPLAEEALQQAVTQDVAGIPARVFAAEHLAAIALQTGRAKDKARLLQFVKSGKLNAQNFQAIIARHNLVAAWQKFETQFLAP